MGSVFSSKNHEPKKKIQSGGSITPTDRAILDLKNSRDRLNRYRNKLDLDSAKLRLKATKYNADGNKTKALALLRLRKHKVNETEKVEEQLLNVLQMVDTIQSTQNDMEIVKAMKVGKNSLDRLHQEMSVDDVVEMMDQVAEGIETENEINRILSEQVGVNSADENDILEAELEELMASENSAIQQNLPIVPDTELPELASKKITTAQIQSERVMVPS
uniref:Charged multivesicular body protein 6 n=1 Tax=Proboscia inermis TaxID=420281 RepID=A0A7S0CM05_9STRA|mmetsp:Transcript_7871/g.8070  ORF Transcript_7871/g.8070 Transcript_7871/m.8070 type:complete len:218 (+) Transcript_7871:76-729(+)